MPTQQKVAVTTGASQGIGATLIKTYRDRDHRAVATALLIVDWPIVSPRFLDLLVNPRGKLLAHRCHRQWYRQAS
jgi:hypothetical protein